MLYETYFGRKNRFGSFYTRSNILGIKCGLRVIQKYMSGVYPIIFKLLFKFGNCLTEFCIRVAAITKLPF